MKGVMFIAPKSKGVVAAILWGPVRSGGSLVGVGLLAMLSFALQHFGDHLEVELAKPPSFATSSLPHVFGVPKWFCRITAPE